MTVGARLVRHFFPARAAPPMEVPLVNSYWVIPGRLLAGEHPCAADELDAPARLERLHNAGIDCFIDLTEVEEMPDYRKLLPRDSRYFRFGIVDASIPGEHARMHEIQACIRDALGAGRRVYVHCRAGIGRTGIAVGCYLVEQGLGGKAALKQLNRLWRCCGRAQSWPKVPQTLQQAEYIRRWPENRAGGDPGVSNENYVS